MQMFFGILLEHVLDLFLLFFVSSVVWLNVFLQGLHQCLVHFFTMSTEIFYF